MGKHSRLEKMGIFVLLIAGIFGALNYSDEISQVVPSGIFAPDDEGLVVGAFNVQVFGTTKAAREDVMDVLGKTIRSYDLIAIQEIRDSSGTALPALLDEVNSDGSQYAYVASDRLGRTVSKEQYAYFYNMETVRLVGAPRTYPEPEGSDPFHREPFIVRFVGIEDPVGAVCVVIHTDPDEATEEINALPAVVDWINTTYPSEPDVIVMGDFNADGTYFDEESDSPLRAPVYHWLIGNDCDTTTGDTVRTYDRIVITRSLDDEYTGTAGIFRYDDLFGVAPPLLTGVSDHYPVYAVFSTSDTADSAVESFLSNLTLALPDIPVSAVPTEPVPSPSDSVEIPTKAVQSWNVVITGVSPVDEWVAIQNTGTGTVSQDMTGWVLTDDTGSNRYAFPNYSLSPGEMVTVYTGTGEPTTDALYWGRMQDVWNNDGDVAYLYEPDGLLVSSYPVKAV
ncbi:lamin tail domain-containing protein [Methanogenium organophilum]|uniref:Lamin tail domain-containing protein n=1 Tax=Methanogenium organophilum TaxID=2199 RepID=A0A9X9T7R5_METOG|nr:lamin tail domain-containing protein [Methanogenium organophilum]WAI01673.1 lamin tail domain-containing protein [Methanogenium organophilum]